MSLLTAIVRRCTWLVRRAPELAVTAATLALALEWTVRDGVPLVATLYYALPMPVVAGALLVALATTLVRERFGWLLACGALLALCVATHRANAFVDAPPAAVGPDQTVRGLLWNTWRARDGLARTIAEIRRQDPDLFVLVEPPVAIDGSPLVHLRELMPEYAFGFVGKRFVVAARGRVHASTGIDFEGGGAARATVHVNGIEVDLLCVDLRSNPLRSRRPPLERIAEIGDIQRSGPALVLGDFNTPRRSVHFERLREVWDHAFESAGEGYDATWPEPAPVHAVDHVWGRSLRFVDCRIVPTALSDHRLVVFTFVP